MLSIPAQRLFSAKQVRHPGHSAMFPILLFLTMWLLIPQNAFSQTTGIKPILVCVDTVTVPFSPSLQSMVPAGSTSLPLNVSWSDFSSPEKQFVLATIDPGGANEEIVVLLKPPVGTPFGVQPVVAVTKNHNAEEILRVETERDIALFGYQNFGSTTVSIKVGQPKNFFFQPPEDRGQPEQFLPGLRAPSFSVIWNHFLQPQITWILDGQQATASLASPRCTKPTAGMRIKGPWEYAAPYLSNDVVSYEGSSWIARRDNLNVLPSESADWMLLARVGDTGPQGDPGVAGIQGLAGVQGVKGDTGAAGVAGPQGPAGPKGDTGAAGIQGPAGPQGPQGVKGDTGVAGAQGPAGPKGDTGAAGAQGAAGPQGPQGPRGDTGAAGVAGPRGPAGLTGPSGPQGPIGPVGPVGPQGVQGPPGNGPFVSAIYTFPQGCKLTIVDSRITGNSVIILQYVGGGIISPTAAEIVNGKFTAVGLPNRRFRYVVQN